MPNDTQRELRDAWDDLIEAANAQDRLSELNDKWGSIVGRMEHHSSGYVESMSYSGPGDM